MTKHEGYPKDQWERAEESSRKTECGQWMSRVSGTCTKIVVALSYKVRVIRHKAPTVKARRGRITKVVKSARWGK